MLDVVADAPIVTADMSAPRSPNTRAALKYLEASGVRAISFTSGAGHVVIHVGYKVDAVIAYWLPAVSARPVAARARKLVGDGTDNIGDVVAAVQAAAVQLHVRLTEHDTAISRATAMAERLDAFLDHLKDSGLLRDFRKIYRQRRFAAKARGRGFMNFGVAELRLKQALIPLLQNGGKPAVGASLFREVFGM
jgi:hypothetical protein